jgi:hypothetical protein
LTVERNFFESFMVDEKVAHGFFDDALEFPAVAAIFKKLF